MEYVDGLVQDSSISSVLAMEIVQSCTKPSMCTTSKNEPKYRSWSLNSIAHPAVRPTSHQNIVWLAPQNYTAKIIC